MQLGSAVSGCAPCKLPAGRTFCCCCTARTAALQLRPVVGPAAGRALNSTAHRVPATFLGGRHATGDYCAQYYPFRRQASDICSSGHGAQQATFCTLMDAPLTLQMPYQISRGSNYYINIDHLHGRSVQGQCGSCRSRWGRQGGWERGWGVPSAALEAYCLARYRRHSGGCRAHLGQRRRAGAMRIAPAARKRCCVCFFC